MPPRQPGESQGHEPPEGSQGSDEPKYITSEDLNRAITARFGAFEGKMNKAMKESFDSFGTAFTSKFDDLLKALPVAKPPEGEPHKPPPIEEHPLFRGLQKQIADLSQKAEAAEAQATAEKARSKEVALRQNVSDLLLKSGVDAAKVRHAVGFLIDTEKRIKLSEEDDSVLFVGEDNQTVDISSGLKSWLKTDDAKTYLPPRGTTGSGARPGGTASPAKGKAPPLGELLTQLIDGQG